MQRPASEKHVARELATPYDRTESKKTMEVVRAGASHDDNGADRLGEVSLKENANKDCADDSDTALQALVRRVVDALSAFIMYIGPYHDERGAASISHLTDETKKELISRLITRFHSTGGRPLADPDATVQKVIQETLKHQHARTLHAGPSGAGPREDASHRYLRDRLPPPRSSSSSRATDTLVSQPDIAKSIEWASEWMYKYIAGRIGVESALARSDGTNMCNGDSDEDFEAAPRVSTQECFSGQVSNLDGVYSGFLLP
ncbi:hypothetical protein VTO73DRAFT_4589 [Trametes versicolor]